ncbi:putative CoA-substrate-specific enzyme activase [Desulfitispora alkaliphila]|uniref:acyl-CoA dehydratase activase n=1 Tax=Desulfitispora alkaliphila TaxID=622674 RepID=UPI003D1BF6F2
MNCYLGIDVGSVSTNIAVLDENLEVYKAYYLRTKGQPLITIQKGLKQLQKDCPELNVKGVGTTGSARHLTATIIGADAVKNEITAHAVAASHVNPKVKTVLEIGGQDSKIIILRNGVVTDFAMNTVCAAGTGSFLDQQAARLGIPIDEFGEMALESEIPIRIAGRCSVFAESDMIHKQQMGHSLADIIAGLSQALVRNYLNNVGKGKDIEAPIVFQGGVAANPGIRKAFNEALNTEVFVPDNFKVMGAIGSAILAKEAVETVKTKFKGFSVSQGEHKLKSFECSDCPNLCEVIEVASNGSVQARWGDKCGKWENCS